MRANSHWAERWLGEPWSTSRDCWAFAREVWLADFGWNLPAVALSSHAAAVTGQMARALEIGLQWQAIDAGQAADGDAAVMGRHQQQASHVGLWVLVDGHRRVLHCRRGAGVVCNTPDELSRAGLAVQRSWRHPSRCGKVGVA